jgi:hypothetical protein
MALERAVIEAQMFNASGEPDIAFMKNRGPLHGRAVQSLAIAAMANFGIDRIGADFVPDRMAMTSGAILRDEAFVVR